ncbi:MAG: class I SAM-dependent methyltransferase [Candidatus Obscuribacterales bacterium]|nr:class I SAM-dependent methyltransferase [Candidatus Obscuribacterales bacterium]
MDQCLKTLSAAYDRTVEDFNEGRDWLEALPIEFRQSEKFKKLLELSDQGENASNAPESKEFLKPGPGLKFLDAGCCANLYNYRLDKWGATYYGVDISPALIEAMRNFADKNQLDIGAMTVAEVASLPFSDNYFDIASCIGVFEYFDLAYCDKALKELYRVLKPGGRLILDLPNPKHPLTETMFELESYLGRPVVAKSRPQFELLFAESFSTIKCQDQNIMINYYLCVNK